MVELHNKYQCKIDEDDFLEVDFEGDSLSFNSRTRNPDNFVVLSIPEAIRLADDIKEHAMLAVIGGDTDEW